MGCVNIFCSLLSQLLGFSGGLKRARFVVHSYREDHVPLRFGMGWVQMIDDDTNFALDLRLKLDELFQRLQWYLGNATGLGLSGNDFPTSISAFCPLSPQRHFQPLSIYIPNHNLARS